MLSESNAHRAATALLARLGEVAIAAAMLRAHQAQSEGRYEDMANWRRIAEAAVQRAHFH
jgi:hypothetical protein